MKSLTHAVAVAALAAALPGCGTAADDRGREPVSGTVTLDGKPLPSGSLTLVPLGDGPAVGATIADGAFAIPRADGPIPGAYRIEILSIQPTGRTVPDPEGPKGTTVEERRNVVPDRYGARSELKADVKKAGPNAFQFKIASRPHDLPTRKKRR